MGRPNNWHLYLLLPITETFTGSRVWVVECTKKNYRKMKEKISKIDRKEREEGRGVETEREKCTKRQSEQTERQLQQKINCMQF
jgi:hypothetical protein